MRVEAEALALDERALDLALVVLDSAGAHDTS
jgi:hypothetical protein